MARRQQHFYEVIVGNIGKVHEGVNLASARRVYKTYVAQSKRGSGRAGGENVTLWKDGDIIQEHEGTREGIFGNPGIQKGKWIPAHAVKFNKDGGVSILY